MALALQTSAAEITYIHDQKIIRYQGDVKSGDAQVLEGLLSSKHKATRVDLNSAGGEVQEALKLMRLVSYARIETRVPEGAICFSSCAFVFMSGASKSMHYQSELGFHAPWLMLGDEDPATGADIKGAFTAGQQLIRDLLATKVIPFELILNFLDRGPSELYFIDTAGKARTLGIKIYGFYDRAIDRWQLQSQQDEIGFPMPSEAAALWILMNELQTGSNGIKGTIDRVGDDEWSRRFFIALNETESFTEFFGEIADFFEDPEVIGDNSSLSAGPFSSFREIIREMRTPSKVFSIKVSRSKWAAYDADDYKISAKMDPLVRLGFAKGALQSDLDLGTIRFTGSGAIYFYPSAWMASSVGLNEVPSFKKVPYFYVDPYDLTAFPGGLRLKLIKDYQFGTYGKPLP